MKRRMHPPLYILSILVLLFIAVLCMPSHVQAAAADQDRPTIAADGYEIVENPTNPAGHALYTHVRQGAFEAMPIGWGDVRATLLPGRWGLAENRERAQATLAGLVNAETGYTTANEVAWDDARMARQYGPGDTIKIRVKFTRPVIIRQDTKLNLKVDRDVYMDIDTAVHDESTVALASDPNNLGAVFIRSVNESGNIVTGNAADNVYVTFEYTVQEGDIRVQGIEMFAWDRPFFRDDDGDGMYHRQNEKQSDTFNLIHSAANNDHIYVGLNQDLVRGTKATGVPDTGTAPNGNYFGAFVWPTSPEVGTGFTYLGHSLPNGRLDPAETDPNLYAVDTLRADTVVTHIVDGIGARYAPLSTAHPTIGDPVAEQTGAFDIEIKFANYHTAEIYAEQPRSNTFGAAEILLDGEGVERADWTITDAAFYGLDAVDPGTYNAETQEIQESDDPFDGEIKHSTHYAVYRATITPPDNFDGDVAISIAENAITDLAGNTSKASGNTLTVPVNTVVEVNIPDETLRAEIEETLSIAAGTAVTSVDMLGLTSLDLGGSDISDLTGLEYATNLEELDLSDTQVEDISALASLTSLLELSLSGTPIEDEDISHLSGLINLKVLDLSDTEVSDITPLSQ